MPNAPAELLELLPGRCAARDFAEVRANGVITREVADMALKMLNVDEKG